MAKQQNQKLKIPYIAKMLMQETDDEHGLTMAQIIDRLADHGIAAERKSIYGDIALLREFGLDIITRQATTTEYAIGNRLFEFPELLLLVDAVQSSRFLTEKKSAALVAHIKELTSMHQAEQLSKRVHVEGRIKMQNESIYYNVDAIQKAIQMKRRIGFQYFDYGVDKSRILRRDGHVYSETPVCLVYSDEYYYLITYNDTHDDFVRYRVDRMLAIQVLDASAVRNERIATFNVEEFSAQAFGMFDGVENAVQLIVDRAIIGALIDRFGKDVAITRADDEHAYVYVTVLESDVFFGWLAQFGVQARILKPTVMAERYCAFLQATVDSYA
jgi:predicted DNA-binding transcriptional regulator YafY